jgi:geranylgeranyl pyrophosphate synthase
MPIPTSDAAQRMTTPSFNDYIALCASRIDAALARELGAFDSEFSQSPAATLMPQLAAAMHYSLLGGGKRIRPMLVYAAAEAIGHNTSEQILDQAACAVEYIHAYSLIHDDLPAMDDDDLRRGRPTCHRQFDEATAILAGDALQTRAFELLAEIDAPAELRLALIRSLAAGSGQRGMVGGQAIDLAAVGQPINLAHLETMHRLKTGALIRTSIRLGALCVGANPQQLQQLDAYGEAIGLSFQVHDDVLDVISDTATLGKQQGADEARNKPTYPALLGLEAAQQLANDLHQQALNALSDFGSGADQLRALSAYIIQRRH